MKYQSYTLNKKTETCTLKACVNLPNYNLHFNQKLRMEFHYHHRVCIHISAYLHVHNVAYHRPTNMNEKLNYEYHE